MSASLRPAGLLRDYTAGEREILVEAGQTVRQALDQIGLPSELVALVLVGDQAVSKDYLLQDGDVVRLHAVVGGG